MPTSNCVICDRVVTDSEPIPSVRPNRFRPNADGVVLYGVRSDGAVLCPPCTVNDPGLAYDYGVRCGHAGSAWAGTTVIRKMFISVAYHFDAGFQVGLAERHQKELLNHASELAYDQQEHAHKLARAQARAHADQMEYQRSQAAHDAWKLEQEREERERIRRWSNSILDGKGGSDG